MRTKLSWPMWIGVVVEHLEAQRRFYRDTLGLTETAAGDDWVHFDLDGNVFELLARTGEPQYDSRRYQVGFAVEDIDSTVAELGKAGIAQLTGIEGGPESPNRWCYFRDPEGNVFEVTQFRNANREGH